MKRAGEYRLTATSDSSGTRKRVFISYAREDVVAAEALYEALVDSGAQPWLDTRDLLAGENWRLAIDNAIASSDYMILLVSANSVSKRGFVQRETRQALEALDECPAGAVFVIPVRLDDSLPAHPRLKELNWVDMFPEWERGFSRIVAALGISTADLHVNSARELPVRRNRAEIESALIDFNSSTAQRVRAVKDLGLLARMSTTDTEKAEIARSVATALRSTFKPVRDMAEAVLVDIGIPALEAIMPIRRWHIPGRTRAPNLAIRMIAAMGEPVIDELLRHIGDDPYLVVTALGEFDFDSVREVSKNLMLQSDLHSRYRQEIFRRMRQEETWDKAELRCLLESGVTHASPVVRVLAARWFADAFPHDAREALGQLEHDTAVVDLYIGGNGRKTVSEWSRDALAKKR